MTTIHDQLNDAVADVRPDLDALAFTARRQGLAKRRLARSLTAVGTVAAVSVLAVGAWGLSGLGGSSDPANVAAPAAEPTTPELPPAPELVQLTGRSTGALLQELVAAHVPGGGTITDLSGQGGVDLVDEEGKVVLSAERYRDTYAQGTLRTATGESMVGVNVQRLMADVGDDCSHSFMEECAVTNLPSGDILRTYVDRTDKPGTTRRVAELLSQARDLRIVLAVSHPNGAVAALAPAQLRAVVTDPAWAFTVPAEVAAAGEAMEFESLDAWIDGQSSAPSAD